MKKRDILKKAMEHTFSIGPDDLASDLSYRNMMYGLGKMHHILDGEVLCFFGPDATITRNPNRWRSGFGYGAVITWDRDDVAFPEMRPNGCGMILVKLDELPEKSELLERVTRLHESDITLDGIRLDMDFGKGNHFFEFYRPIDISAEFDDRLEMDRYYAILHCSSQERKHEVYGKVDEGEWVDTPLGKVCVLKDAAAEEYLRLWRDYESFCKMRREYLIKEVLGSELEVISNKTHQGLFGNTEIRLGCYNTLDRSDKSDLFPMTVGWEHPVFILKGERNLKDSTIEEKGFVERAERYGLIEKIRNINILPHGGGYMLDIPYFDIEVECIGKARYFTLRGAEDAISSKYGKIMFTNPKELPFGYRGEDVINKTLEYELAKPVAKLQPVGTLKV